MSELFTENSNESMFTAEKNPDMDLSSFLKKSTDNTSDDTKKEQKMEVYVYFIDRSDGTFWQTRSGLWKTSHIVSQVFNPEKLQA